MVDRQQADTVRAVLGEEGTVRFGIKAKNTPENIAIHEAFKSFCEKECNNDYTLGLKYLLESMQTDFKYESLSERLMYIREELDELKTKVDALSRDTKKEKEVSF